MAYITNSDATQTGKTININNAIKYKINELELLGDTNQTGTPSPSSPVDINTVTGQQNIVVTSGTNTKTYGINLGKNLFNKNGDFSYGSGANNTSLNEQGQIVSTSNFSNRRSKGQLLNVKRNTNYVVSGTLISANGTNESNNACIQILYSTATSIKRYDFSTSLEKPYNFNFTFNSGNNNQVWISFNGWNSSSTGTTETIYDNIQIEEGTTPTEYAPYFTPIELCKIGDYQDKIYKSNNKWYIHKEVGKINSYNGETITTNYISTTGGLDTGATIYYVLDTPTNTEITNETLINELEQASKLQLYDGINNVIVNGDLASYININYYNDENEYVDVLYGGDSQNKAKIWFNDVEMQDFGIKCEKITRTARIMPNDGNKVFTLSNFVSTELEIILHDVDVDDLVDQVKVSIGTVVESSSLGDTYEWIPLGVFNIQDQPVVNDNKVTLKLRDNRVKFDFNYNGQTLIDNSYVLTTDTTYQEGTDYYVYTESVSSYTILIAGTDYQIGDAITGNVYVKKGYVTKKEILEDICTQAGVINEIEHFECENDHIGIYDSSITATTYISYLAEQCGCTPTINRDGHLIFIDYTNLFTWKIPKSILPKPFEVGTPFEIERVVYESGIIKYESSTDDTLSTLYLNTNNPYIDRYEQINYIYNLLNGFALDSVTTQKMLGNPAIDPYDLIQIYDDSDISHPIIATTLANNTYIFNGKHSNTFTTTIGKEQRKENVSIKSQSTFEKWARTSIDAVEAEIRIESGRTDVLENNQDLQYTEIMNQFNDYATLESIENITNQVTQLQTDTYTKTEIQQIANGTGADGVTVSAVISTEAQFDKDGMHYSKTNAPTSSTINYKGLEVDDNRNNELLFAGYDEDDQSLTYGSSIVRTDNLTVKTYLQCANGKGRFEQYTDDDNNTGVGFFLT